MALTPLLPGGAEPAYQAGIGATPQTSELRAQASGTIPSSIDPSLADTARRVISDPVSLSAQARQAGAAQDAAPASQSAKSAAAPKSANGDPLTEGEEKQIAELKKRDREVRQHEQAHQAAGGQYASAPSYEYQKGPDGQQYAVGGEVQIDASPIPGDPEATIEKMRIVKAAALAPAEPSGQDRKVAASADAAAQQARAELAAQEREERQAALEGDRAEGPSQPGQPQPANDAASPSDADADQPEIAAFGFSGDPPAPAALNQANGAYAATTRAQSVNLTSIAFA
ncbi:putative metalloprotease CJM1_0395 family protein [Oceanicaulis sp. MMSF_3324]|uniref:putative metalloprotease CJM1_0395 family protein n=1 Tax=Oceanicaulis sp. MMSF_3324 TaxID=3046702 RepID=UPI0027400002|nr:putative metalloprotease CJM1_0395 family protein [Oceanicaulis sp. MMSF_3324]